MVLGIISNPTALSVGQNLAAADNDLQASAKRISSGNKIANAYDDVSGLAIGSILSGNISTLQAALVNTSQGMSMLGIADGSLKNEGDILQRMKALATQANSALGEESSQKLNQEFQNLTQELDRIAGSTNFGGRKLIDGSLYAPAKIVTSTKTDATQAQARITINNALAPAANNAGFIYINGAAMPFAVTADIGTVTGTTGDLADITVDTTLTTTAANQAQALYSSIQSALNYAGNDANVIGIKSKLSELQFAYNPGDAYITITANVAGTVGNGAGTDANNGSAAFGVAAMSTNANDVLLNGGNVAGAAFTAANATGLGYADLGNGFSPLQIAVDGDLNGGTFPLAHNANAPDIALYSAYSGSGRTVAQGTVTDTILKALNTSNTNDGSGVEVATGVDTSLISNNASFAGKIQGFKVIHKGLENVVDLELKVGDYTYTAASVNTNFAADTRVTLSAVGGNGGSLSLTFNANDISVKNQDDADLIANRLNSAFNGLTFFQSRNVSGYKGSGTILDVNNNIVGDLAGSEFKFISSEFKNVEIAKVSVQAPMEGGSNASITFTTKNGEVYTSGYNNVGNVTPLGRELAPGEYGFVSQTNPKNVLIFNYVGGGAATNLSLTSTSAAEATEKALAKAFNINTGAASVAFQVGLSASDNISLQIPGAKTSDIFLDENGNYKSISIETPELAQTASVVLDRAISVISDIRSNVGAIQSRIRYAADNINTSIQNITAARDVFLATDIPSESTAFAMAQVREQASTSVLAQINQLRQNILKLVS
ncbi:A-type flagellin [Rickettsiales bacterium Ac37b]|nr:A-type flagellin [Rickettsiales bacterium Ac37b]